MSSRASNERALRGLALFIVLVAAKLAAMWHSLPAWSGWSAVAFTWQEAVIGLGVAFLEGATLDGLPRPRPWMGARMTNVARSVYWTVAVWAAINIPVGRVLGTSLTLPMLRGAGGALADSLRLQLTPTNLALVTGTIAGAALLPRVLGRLRQKPRQLIAGAAIALSALGPLSMRHAAANGTDRSAVLAFAESLTPHVTAGGGRGDWRESPFPSVAIAAADDLAALRGAAEGRNVVVVSLESTAAQYLSLYGGDDLTPTLAALSRTGLVFDHAYAAYPESIKGLFSILCSTFPAFDVDVQPLSRTRCDAIPSVLHRQGYRTALFHSGRFDYLGMSDVIRGRGFDTLEDAGDIGGHHQSSFGVDEPATVERMLQWVDHVPRGQRFLLTYLPIAGHHPYETTAAGPFGNRDDFSRYRNAVHEGDAALKTLVDGFHARGLDNRTVWIVFGDHGEAFGQHPGNYGHTFFLYEENVHVPLMIVAPGLLDAQRRVSHTVSLVDVAPTILDLLGVAPAATYQGQSALDGRRRMALFLTDYSLPLAGLVDGRWKAIEDISSGRVQLFELAQDGVEARDVSALHVERARAYAASLQGWAAAQKDYILNGRR
jgi:arylsulfatase A-like enzyme